MKIWFIRTDDGKKQTVEIDDDHIQMSSNGKVLIAFAVIEGRDENDEHYSIYHLARNSHADHRSLLEKIRDRYLSKSPQYVVGSLGASAGIGAASGYHTGANDPVARRLEGPVGQLSSGRASAVSGAKRGLLRRAGILAILPALVEIASSYWKGDTINDYIYVTDTGGPTFDGPLYDSDIFIY